MLAMPVSFDELQQLQRFSVKRLFRTKVTLTVVWGAASDVSIKQKIVCLICDFGQIRLKFTCPIVTGTMADGCAYTFNESIVFCSIVEGMSSLANLIE